MCAIFGMVNLRREALRHPELAGAMASRLAHRGPDGGGRFARPHVILGTERLRINDLDPRADSPFRTEDDGVALACNGEIYNADELRERFTARPCRTGSDVEPLLSLYLEKGDGLVEEIDGMFALAVWDEARGLLTLARDRAGEKPLHVCRFGDELWFASELQALLLHPKLDRSLDRPAVDQFHTFGYVPEPRTPFASIRKLEAGRIVRFTAEGRSERRYWDPFAEAAGPPRLEEPVEPLRELLRSAVRKQLRADVPVGVFLSGGVDSALIAAVARKERPEVPLESFTAAFEATSYDESERANAIAGDLGLRQNRVPVHEASLRRALDAVSSRVAEPIADPALLPTFLLGERARERGVPVVLGGEGADELFGGYPTHLGHRLLPRLRLLPRPLRSAVAALLGRVPAARTKVPLEMLFKKLLAESETPFLERHLAWFGAGRALWAEGLEMPEAAREIPRGLDDASAAMLLDYATYLRDDLLPKLDRATMLSAVEARAPYLDRDLTRFAWRLPVEQKIRRWQGKHALKRAAAAWLPDCVVHRRKRGLSVPVADWIDRGLSEEVDRLLHPERLRRQGLVDADAVGALLTEHRRREANHARPIWTAFVFQRWLEHWAPEWA